MNKYEVAIVLNAKSDEEVRKATLDKINEYIVRFEGAVTSVDEWGKRRLAYEINDVKEGFYYFFHVDANADFPAELERRLRIMEQVLRYLVVRQED